MFRLRICIGLGILTLPSLLFGQAGGLQLAVMGGVFSPTNDEMQRVYGDGPTAKIALAIPISDISRLRVSAYRFEQDGDPFYRSRDFDAGDVANLTMSGVSLGMEFVPWKTGRTYVSLGAAMDYVFAEEDIAGLLKSDGNTVGGHLYANPEFQIAGRLSLVTELSYRFLEMTFKDDRTRFEFNLSGANLLVGLGYDLSR